MEFWHVDERKRPWCTEKGQLRPAACDSAGGPDADSAPVGLGKPTEAREASAFGSIGLGDGSQTVALCHFTLVVATGCAPSVRTIPERGLLGAKESPREDRVHCEERAG